MHRAIDSILNEEFTIGKHYKAKYIDFVFFFFITIFAIFARISMFDYTSGDYNSFLSPWFQQIKEAGGLPGIGLSLGDYTPSYIYILSFLTYLPIDSLVSIKVVSCIFDFVCALIIMNIVLQEKQKFAIANIAYAVVLFAPTVILNSALWAQCDIIFTTFLVLCIYYFTKNKPMKATVFFAIAFVFKLQAIFLAPFLLFMWLKGKMKFRHFFLIPAIYLISILPAFFMGRPLTELLTIYISQSGQYNRLSLNAPNLYMWLNETNAKFITFAGILLCGVVILTILYLTYQKQFKIDNNIIYAFALLFALIIPFLLPHMHERYFYVADVLAIIYAFQRPKRFPLALGITLCSLLCYCPYLFAATPVDISYVAIFMLVIICFVIIDIKNLMNENAIKE